MKALTKILAGGVFVAALVSAAPAAAQYYPGGGYGYPGGGGNVIGQVLNQVLGGGYSNYGGGYGAGNQQAAVSQCVGAVQARLNGNYGGGYNPYGNGGYGGYGGYANNGNYGGGRVLGISRVEPRSGGGVTVRGVASSGAYAGYNGGYGYNGPNGYNGQGQVDLTFKCKADYRGFVTSVDIDRATRTQSYNYSPYSGSPYDYSQYGYRRY